MSMLVCPVCPHSCQLKQGEKGLCGVRQAQVGRIAPLNYGRCTALALDRIEKKPLARFYPGTAILSYGSFGCNLSCEFCQNWEIAHAGKSTQRAKEGREISSFLSPHDLVEEALKCKSRGNIGIAFTYNEPLVCPEYVVDVADAAKGHDLKLVLVTNAYVMPEVAQQVFNRVNAANIDLKAFSQEFYNKLGAPAGLATVKRTLEIAVTAGCHLEVTTLIVPGLNDSPEELAEEAAWLAALDPNIALHLNRFLPAHQMVDIPPTAHQTMYALKDVAQGYLKHVYLGNMW